MSDAEFDATIRIVDISFSRHMSFGCALQVTYLIKKNWAVMPVEDIIPIYNKQADTLVYDGKSSVPTKWSPPPCLYSSKHTCSTDGTALGFDKDAEVNFATEQEAQSYIVNRENLQSSRPFFGAPYYPSDKNFSAQPQIDVVGFSDREKNDCYEATLNLTTKAITYKFRDWPCDNTLSH